MIFPNVLPFVTFYGEDTETYYELPVANAAMRFQVENYYDREAISAKKDFRIRGIRFAVDLAFDQTMDHDVMRDLVNAMQVNSTMSFYMQKEIDIDQTTDFVQIISTSFASDLNYNNQIRQHNYRMSFTGTISDFGIGLYYVIDNDGFFVLTNDGSRIIADATVY